MKQLLDEKINQTAPPAIETTSPPVLRHLQLLRYPQQSLILTPLSAAYKTSPEVIHFDTYQKSF